MAGTGIEGMTAGQLSQLFGDVDTLAEYLRKVVPPTEDEIADDQDALVKYLEDSLAYPSPHSASEPPIKKPVQVLSPEANNAIRVANGEPPIKEGKKPREELTTVVYNPDAIVAPSTVTPTKTAAAPDTAIAAANPVDDFLASLKGVTAPTTKKPNVSVRSIAPTRGTPQSAELLRLIMQLGSGNTKQAQISPLAALFGNLRG